MITEGYIFSCNVIKGLFGLSGPRQPTTTPPRLRWWCGWVIYINVVIIGSVVVVLDLVMVVLLSLCEPKAVARVMSSRDMSRVTARPFIILVIYLLVVLE